MIPKFRAYETDRKAMHYTDKNLVVCFSDNGVDVIDHTTFSSSCMDIDNFVLMQSTGLKDKNGVEIFEGDIVVFNDESDDKYIVCTFLSCFGIRFSDVGFVEFSTMFDGSVSAEDVFTVIGNIYEHPYLLEE